MRFIVDNTVLRRFPGLKIGLLVLDGIDNTKNNDDIVKFLREQEGVVRSGLKRDELSVHPEIALWREAYSWMGAKPKKYKCSTEALLRRVLSDEEIPSISAIVDLYNAISIKHILPIGGDDISNVDGDICLAIAKGDERFLPIGADETESPKEGEVVYLDEKDVLCRRWNWRECDKSKLTTESNKIVIYIESLRGEVADALAEMKDKVKQFFSVEAKDFVVDKDNNGFDFDNTKLIKNTEKIVAEEKVPVEKKKEKKKRDSNSGKTHKKEVEHMHWADRIALEVEERINRDPQLKEVYEKQGALVYDEKTPSGVIHIGSGRGWVIHDVIAKAMRRRGMNAKFILSSDDMDPYDKPNKDLDSSWDKYLGMPFKDIPSPVEGYKSFGDYFFSQVTEKFAEFGIECELESTGEQYENGAFNPMIKLILDNYKIVQETYTSLYGDTIASHRIPFNVKCSKCGKIATTLATAWDPEKEELGFECKEDLVTWAKGCGHKGSISPYNGNGKFPWKVEWAAKWPTKNVIVEYAGKDHFTKGGSRTFSCKLATDLIKYPSPYPSNKYNTGKGYEFFTIGGAKMSTSKGRGLSFREAAEQFPPQILRYFLVKSRPNSMIDFDPYGTNDLILLFDRFDECERIYFGEKEGHSESDLVTQKRIYELSHVGDVPKKCPIQIPLSFAGIVLQVGLGNPKKAIEILMELGHISKNASEEDLKPVYDRLNFAKEWIKNYAPEQYKFQLVEQIKKVNISSEVKKAMIELRELLLKNKYDEKSLFDEFYTLCEKHDLKNTDFFSAVYRTLIDKEKGPKLAPFILTIGQKKVVELLSGLE